MQGALHGGQRDGLIAPIEEGLTESEWVASQVGRPVIKVNEFSAIGIGGTSLAKKDRALVVSLGTGTAR